MADVEKVVDEGTDELDFPELDLKDFEQEVEEGEDKKSDTKEADGKEPDEVELTEVEQAAYNQGWRPKAEFVKAGGDASQWRSAEWWTDRGELLGQQKELKRELKQVKDAFVQMADHNRKAYLKGRQDVLRSLKTERKEALKEGDLPAVAELEDKIDAVEEEVTQAVSTMAAPRAPQANPQVSTMYQRWLDTNKWYTTDETLHNYANATMKKFVDFNPDATPEEALEFVTNNVKSEFAHRFNGMKKVVRPGVDGQRSNGAGSGDKGDSSIDGQFNKIVSGLDSDSRRVVLDMIKSKHISKKEFVEDYPK